LKLKEESEIADTSSDLKMKGAFVVFVFCLVAVWADEENDLSDFKKVTSG
jgi:hypothetical protein